MSDGVRRRRRRLRAAALVLGVSFAAGLAVGGAMLWIAFQENPQGEYFDPVTGAVNWPHTLTLFGLYMLTIAGPLALAGWAAYTMRSGLRVRRR